MYFKFRKLLTLRRGRHKTGPCVRQTWLESNCLSPTTPFFHISKRMSVSTRFCCFWLAFFSLSSLYNLLNC